MDRLTVPLTPRALVRCASRVVPDSLPTVIDVCHAAPDGSLAVVARATSPEPTLLRTDLATRAALAALAALRDGAASSLPPAERLAAAFQCADVCVRATACPPYEAVVEALALIHADGARWIAHVGGCRAYRIADGRWQHLTRDHTLGGEHPEIPPSPDYARAVTRGLGLRGSATPEITVTDASRLLLCAPDVTALLDARPHLAVVTAPEIWLATIERAMPDDAWLSAIVIA